MSLNGPLHYIDSDVLPGDSLTKMEEFKCNRLRLYGIGKLNFINYQDWEAANKYEQVAEKFIQHKIDNALSLPITF